MSLTNFGYRPGELACDAQAQAEAERIMATRLELYGHRGACAELPENTYPSFDRALEAGVTTIESDLHLTKDKVVVLSHDATAERMAGLSKRIGEATLEEVQGWDVGWGFSRQVHSGAEKVRPFVGQGFSIPTLEDVLRRYPSVRFNLDVKQVEPSMVQEVIDVIAAQGATPRVTLASFHGDVLKEIRAKKFGGQIVLGKRELMRIVASPRSVLEHEPGLGHRAQVPLRYGPLNFASEWFLKKCHAVGIKVDYWTINSAKEAVRLAKLGADGIMTDDPARVAPALMRAGYLSGPLPEGG